MAPAATGRIPVSNMFEASSPFLVRRACGWAVDIGIGNATWAIRSLWRSIA